MYIYVSAKDTDGNEVIGDHFEFKTVPRIGERVILNNRGGMDKEETGTPLQVMEVINHAVPKGDVMNPMSYVELHCRVMG
jgi:hypothetical protein